MASGSLTNVILWHARRKGWHLRSLGLPNLGRAKKQARPLPWIMGDTYALPTLAERRAQPAARIAYFAHVVREHERQFAGVPFEQRTWHVVAMCVSCGRSAASWCDNCELAGRRFTTVWGQEMVGSPLCHNCEGDGVACTVCGV